jgi:hypothetical protein
VDACAFRVSTCTYGDKEAIEITVLFEKHSCSSRRGGIAQGVLYTATMSDIVFSSSSSNHS